MLADLLSLLDPLHGDSYLFWSGIGAGSPAFVLLAGWWHHHNCSHHRCPRFKTYPHGHLRLCRLHHPEHSGRITRTEIDRVSNGLRQAQYTAGQRTMRDNAALKRKVGHRA